MASPAVHSVRPGFVEASADGSLQKHWRVRTRRLLRLFFDAAESGAVWKMPAIVARIGIDTCMNQDMDDNHGWRALHYAAFSDQVEICRYLIDELEFDINCVDKTHRTPLHVAARNGCIETVKMLIGRKANVDARDKRGWTPLHVALFRRENEVALHLIEEAKANVFAAFSFGSVLSLATPETLPAIQRIIKQHIHTELLSLVRRFPSMEA